MQPFVLEGATLARFLDWAARQQGWRWTYADPTMRARFDRVVLHGTLEDLTVPEALDAVLPTCGLAVRRAGDLLDDRSALRRSRRRASPSTPTAFARSQPSPPRFDASALRVTVTSPVRRLDVTSVATSSPGNRASRGQLMNYYLLRSHLIGAT